MILLRFISAGHITYLSESNDYDFGLRRRDEQKEAGKLIFLLPSVRNLAPGQLCRAQSLALFLA
jgi:hypothetical protein